MNKQLTPMERITRAWPYLSPWQRIKFLVMLRVLVALTLINPRLAMAVVRAR